MMMRLIPPIWTMFSPPTTGSRLWVPPRAARMTPMMRANTEERETIAFLPPRNAEEGSCSMRPLLGRATAAAAMAMTAGTTNARKLPSIAMTFS